MKEDKNLVENKSIEDIIKENEPEKKPKRKIVWLIVHLFYAYVVLYFWY